MSKKKCSINILKKCSKKIRKINRQKMNQQKFFPEKLDRKSSKKTIRKCSKKNWTKNVPENSKKIPFFFRIYNEARKTILF